MCAGLAADACGVALYFKVESHIYLFLIYKQLIALPAHQPSHSLNY
jgi:hypothetical protein